MKNRQLKLIVLAGAISAAFACGWFLQTYVAAQSASKAQSASNIAAPGSGSLLKLVTTDRLASIGELGKAEPKSGDAQINIYLLSVIGSDDPDAAWSWAKDAFSDDPKSLAQARVAIFESYGRKHGESAIRNIQEKHPEDRIEAGLALRGWATASMDSAASYLRLHAREPIMKSWEVMTYMAEEVSRQRGQMGIEKWMLDFADPKDRVVSIAEGVKQMANLNMEAAASWVTAHSDQPDTSYAACELAKRYAKENPSDAMNWVLTMRGQPPYSTAGSEVIRSWVSGDADGALNWITTHGGESDNFAPDAARELAQQDLPLAVTLAKTIRSEPQRKSAVSNVLIAGSHNRDQLRTLIASNILEPEERAMVERILGVKSVQKK